MVGKAPRLRHVVIFGEKRVEIDDCVARPHLRLEPVDEGANRLDELAFALTERDLLVLDIINLTLILLEELRVSFTKHLKCALSGWLGVAIDLRLNKTALELLDLRPESIEDALDRLLLLLKSGWSSEHCQFFLLNFKC